MLKSKLFKSLVVASLISAICVPVFAAEETTAPQPTVREKVEKILSEDDAVRRPMPFGGRRGPQLTQEQREARAAARVAWMEMTPQQNLNSASKCAKNSWHSSPLKNAKPLKNAPQKPKLNGPA